MALDIPRLRAELDDILKFLPSFFANPVEGVRTAPDWSWPALLSLQAGAAAVSGVVGGLVSMNVWRFLGGLFLFPIISLIQVAVISFFLASYFALAHSTYLERKRLAGVVVVANLPYLALHVISGWVPLIDLIGFLTTCALLVVGLSEHFRLERKDLLRLIGGIYLAFFLVWATSQYRNSKRADEYRVLSAPKSLDRLESEIR